VEIFRYGRLELGPVITASICSNRTFHPIAGRARQVRPGAEAVTTLRGARAPLKKTAAPFVAAG